MTLQEQFHIAHKERALRLFGAPPAPRLLRQGLPSHLGTRGTATAFRYAHGVETPPSNDLPARRILKATAASAHVSVKNLTGELRYRPYVRARHVAMYLIREDAELSFGQIGRLFGRDHTTIMHGHRKVAENLGEYENLLTAVRRTVAENSCCL